MRWFCISCVLLGLATTARASGINLSWDRCAADGQVLHKSFACDTNAGREAAVGSFVLDAGTPAPPSREEMVFDFQVQGAVLPVWWDFATLSSCRRNQMVLDAVPLSEPTVCRTSSSGFVDFVRDNFRYPAPDHMVVTVGVLLTGTPLVPGAEYFCLRLTFGNAATTGAGACGGCFDPVAITLSQLRVLAGTDQTLAGPALANTVFWQSSNPTATRRASWTAVKALFH